MPTLEYTALIERGFGPGELVLVHPEWFVPASQQHRDPWDNRVALEARALAVLPLPDRIETIARLAHSWPKLLMKAMTKLAADTAKRNKAARPRATKAATVVPVQQEVVDNDALVTATLLERYMTFETILRRHKHDATNMAYPFAIELTNKSGVMCSVCTTKACTTGSDQRWLARRGLGDQLAVLGEHRTTHITRLNPHVIGDVIVDVIPGVMLDKITNQ